MFIKKPLFTLSAALYLNIPIYADYAYCVAHGANNDKKTFYYSAVFYTGNSNVTLDLEEGKVFAKAYLEYSAYSNTSCYRGNSKKELNIMRLEEITDQRRLAKVVETNWEP